jgi:hypothetical protein
MNAYDRPDHVFARGAAWAILGAVVLSACQPREEQLRPTASVDTAGVIATIDSMRSLFERSVAGGDFDTMFGMLAEGALMVGPGGPSWDSLRAASPYPWPPGATLEMRPIETVVLSEQWAYDFGTSTATYTPPGSTERRTLRDTYLLLLRNTEDGWKIYREVASPDLPPERMQ